LRYCALSVLGFGGHEFDLSGSRDVIADGHVTFWFPVGHFLLWSFGTKPLSLGFRDIQWQMWDNAWHDLNKT